MPNVGFQSLWVTGSRVFFQRDATGGVIQPIIDMGVMDVVSPNIEIEEIECLDADGGIQVPIDTQITSLDESYEATFKNLNLDNLALMWLSNPAAEYGQTIVAQFNKHRAQPGRLIKIADGDYDLAAVPNALFGITSIRGVANGKTTSAAGVQPYATSPDTILSVTSSVIKLAGVDRTAELKAGDKIVVCGLDVPAEDGVFTLSIDSVLSVADTDVTVVETITDQAAPGTTGVLATTLIEGTDWETVSLERGFIRMITGGNLTADADVSICVIPREITGLRRLLPLTLQGSLRGSVIVIWGRDRNSQQTARTSKVSVTPGTPNFQVEDYSRVTLNFTVLTEITAAEPAGRVEYWLGDLPDVS